MSNDNAANDPMNFVKNMWGNMGFTLPGMVTPTFDLEEIEKKVTDLKAVEGWLKMNLSMLQMTIQSLEMQCATLNAVRTMGNMAASQASSAAEPGATPADAPTDEAGREAFAQATMWPWNLMQQMQDQMQQAQEAQQAAAAQQAAQSASEEPPKAGSKKGKKAQ
jgi:hypothetical protein